MLLSIIKLVLVILSVYLTIYQFKRSHPKLGFYWSVVTLYWAVNLLQGLI